MTRSLGSEPAMTELVEIVRLLILAVPVAWVAWTVTKEEVFREARDYCAARSRDGRFLLHRKFFYVFTCEYCFSHWVTLGFQFVFQFRMAFDDWRGYLVGFAALVWMANAYMSLYQRLRVDIRSERAEADHTEQLAGKPPAAGGSRRGRPSADGGAREAATR